MSTTDMDDRLVLANARLLPPPPEAPAAGCSGRSELTTQGPMRGT